MLLGFAEKNPGMTRVLIGDALVTEDDRLQTASTSSSTGSRLDQAELRVAIAEGLLPADTDPAARAGIVLLLHPRALAPLRQSGFKRSPTELLSGESPLIV